MKFTPKYLITGVVFLFCTTTQENIQAQIIPDGTTPNTAIIGDCTVKCDITGGIQAGNNLFQSFREFNINAGEQVYFTDPGVANIFSRVTGGNLSEIFGTLGVTGNANLWLLNPKGIIFSEGAILDINGSFIATTADKIQFGAKGDFSALPNNTENLALLTVNPDAFFYNQMGQGNPIIVESGALLSVPEQENIVLLGAQNNNITEGILLSEGTIKAPQGKVELGAVATDGKVSISPGFQLQFAENVTKGNITLAQGSAIDVSGIGSGSVTLQGKDVSLTQRSNITANTLGNVDGKDINLTSENLVIQDNSFISASTFAQGEGGNVNITTENSLNIIGEGIIALQQLIGLSLSGQKPDHTSSSSIHTATYGEGNSGNINIQTQNLGIHNGSWIINSTVDKGNGANVTINATDRVILDASGIFSSSTVGSTGNLGTLTINTQDLLIQNSSVMSSATLGEGRGGNLNITASESVILEQTLPGTLVPTGIYNNTVLGSGKAGDLTINTKNVLLQDGSQLSSSSGLITSNAFIPFGGSGGNITINATDSIKVIGTSPDGIFPSSIVNDTRTSSPAGNIILNTSELNIQGKALISASSLGRGNGGDLIINADNFIKIVGAGSEELQQLVLQGLSGKISVSDIRSGLFTATAGGKAGAINITSPQLILEEGALISTATLSNNKGGDLTINTVDKVEIIGSAITSASLGKGNAGSINVNTGKFITRDSGIIATSTIGEGNAGDLTINATDSIELLNTLPKAIIGGGINTSNSRGQAQPGNITLNTEKLVIRGGMRVNAVNIISDYLKPTAGEITTSNTVSPTNININAKQFIEIDGSSSQNNSTSGISSATGTNLNASNIQITTGNLSVKNNGNIAVNSLGNGAAGSLEIVADSVYLSNGANFNATTVSGKGGNISLKIDDILQLTNNAMITTNAQNQGDGGNINIDANFAIAFENSAITAEAIGGNGGNIIINTKDLFIAPDSRISASSQLGIDGKVNIQTLTATPRNNLIKLPEKILDSEKGITQSCGGENSFASNKFIYVGRGGLPPSPFDRGTIQETILLPDFGNSDRFNELTQFSFSSIQTSNITDKIIEATKWKINPSGNIVLIAEESQPIISQNNNCPFHQ